MVCAVILRSVRPLVALLLAGLLTVACAGQRSTAPSGVPSAPVTDVPSPPVAVPSGPALSRIWLCCGSNQVTISTERQIEARATYADGSIKDITSDITAWRSSNLGVATISSAGVVKGLAAGDFTVSGSYQGLEATWGLYVFMPTSYVRPDEVVGWVQERTVNGPVAIPGAELEVIGGVSHGRTFLADLGGFFRIGGLGTPGFDLIVRARGYESKGFRVNQLGRDVSSDTFLAPASTVVSDVLEGAVCWPTRTINTTFTPTVPGFLRITSGRFNSTIRALYANGVLINSHVYNNTDIELSRAVTYELRVTGSCDYNPEQNVRMTFLRPR